MAAMGHGPYGQVAHSTTHDVYGAPLQHYASQTPSSSNTPPFLAVPSGAATGHYLEQATSAHEWGQQHAHAPVHGGWSSGHLAPAMQGMGEVGVSSSAGATAGSALAYSSLRGVHGVPLSQYDWHPEPRAYTPCNPLPPPPSSSVPAHYGYRPDAFAPYPHASHAPPLTYQPLHAPVPAPAPQPPAPEQHSAPAYHHPAPAPSLPSLLPNYDQRDDFIRQNPLSTTNATRDGSAAVSTPSTRGTHSPEVPPALVEPVSPPSRDGDGAFAAGGSIELPAQRGVPPLIPPLGHISSTEVGRVRAPPLPTDFEPIMPGGNKRAATDAKSAAGKKKKEPKDLANRKYACNECDQRFARPSALATHVLTHTKEKPFVCCTCNRGFAVMSNLRRHCRVRSHALAPEQESSVRPRTITESRSSGSSGASGGAAPDPGPPPLRALAPAPPSLQPRF
ncbi:hypothetical protein JCM10449v2_002461 [Rhodotorula kratochvilovae]